MPGPGRRGGLQPGQRQRGIVGKRRRRARRHAREHQHGLQRRQGGHGLIQRRPAQPARRRVGPPPLPQGAQTGRNRIGPSRAQRPADGPRRTHDQE